MSTKVQHFIKKKNARILTLQRSRRLRGLRRSETKLLVHTASNSVAMTAFSCDQNALRQHVKKRQIAQLRSVELTPKSVQRVSLEGRQKTSQRASLKSASKRLEERLRWVSTVETPNLGKVFCFFVEKSGEKRKSTTSEKSHIFRGGRL